MRARAAAAATAAAAADLFSLARSVIIYHVLRMQPREYSRMFMLRPRTVAFVVALLCCVFTSRAAFDITSAAGAVTVSTSGSASAKDTAIFITAYTWWELVPIAMLLSTIATGSVGRAHSTNAAPMYGVFGAIAEMQVT